MAVVQKFANFEGPHSSKFSAKGEADFIKRIKGLGKNFGTRTRLPGVPTSGARRGGRTRRERDRVRRPAHCFLPTGIKAFQPV